MTGNTQELQWRPSPAQKWFMHVVHTTTSDTLAKQLKSSKDPQGMYVIAPDGTSYGFRNDHYPDDVSKFMDDCLAGYRANPGKKVEINAGDQTAGFAVAPPKDAVVVGVYSRIKPLPEHVWGLNRGIGRDWLWLYPAEMKALASAPIGSNGSVKIPADLIHRIARFHLVDDVRGTPDLWKQGEIRTLTYSAKATDSPDGTRRILLNAAFDLRTGSDSRGYKGNLEAQIEVDRNRATVTHFRGYAVGNAWGRGTYTPFPPPGKYRLHVAFHESEEPISRIVPPEEVSTANNDAAYHHPAPAPPRPKHARKA